jgi:hypothetical protein
MHDEPQYYPADPDALHLWILQAWESSSSYVLNHAITLPIWTSSCFHPADFGRLHLPVFSNLRGREDLFIASRATPVYTNKI